MSKDEVPPAARKTDETPASIYSSPESPASISLSPEPYPSPEPPAYISPSSPPLQKTSLVNIKTGSTATPHRAALVVPSTPLPAASPEKFFSKNEMPPDTIAVALIEYFSRPSEGLYSETVFPRNGEPYVTQKPFVNPIPLLSEFCRSVGLTVKDLRALAKRNPNTIGRAVEVAKDVEKEYIIRRGLAGEYNSQFAQFVAVNETDMRMKSDVEVRRVDLNRLLDQIEQADKPNTIQAIDVEAQLL